MGIEEIDNDDLLNSDSDEMREDVAKHIVEVYRWSIIFVTTKKS